MSKLLDGHEMSLNHKHQASLFFVAMSTSAATLACTAGQYDPGTGCVPASAGFYVPTTGMTAALAAPVGSYVNASGATAPTLASPGTFVSVAGATAANLALPGYYIPSSGASSATEVASGFYTPSTGSVNQLPAGGAAAPLANAIQARSIFNDLSTDLIDSQETSALKIATGFQKSRQDQTGLTSGKFNINSSAVVVQADIDRNASGATGVQFSLGQQKLSSGSEAENSGNSYQISAFNSGVLGGGQYQSQLLYGQTVGDTKRVLVATTNSSTSSETLTSQGKVTWTGLQTQFKYPLNETVKLLTQLGVVSYSMNGVTETSSVANSLVGLNAESLKYTSVPYTLGLLYDVSTRGDDGLLKTPLTATVALVGDLSSAQVLKIHSSYDFDLPVFQSKSAVMLRLKFKAWEPSKDATLSGTLQAVHGTGLSTYMAGLSFVKKW